MPIAASCLVAMSLCFPTGTLNSMQRRPAHEWSFAPTEWVDSQFTGTRGSFPLQGPATPRFLNERALILPQEGPLVRSLGALESKALPEEAFTLEAVVAIDREQPWGGFVCALEDNGSHERGWLLGVQDGRFTVAASTERTGGLQYLRGLTRHEPGQWYHVAGTYDGESLKLYVNGQLDAESEKVGGPILYDPTHDLVFGAYLDENERYPILGALHSAAIDDRAWKSASVARRAKKALGQLQSLPLDASGATGRASSQPTVGSLQPAINRAIDRGVEHLLSRQHRDGSWSHHLTKYRNGSTSLHAYALLAAGVSRSSDSILRAVEFLQREDPTQVYSAGFQLLLLAELRADSNSEWARRIVELLLDWESEAQPGSWGYPAGRPDLSNAQLAVLGFWAASRLGVDVDTRVWKRIVTTTCEAHQTVVEKVAWPEGITRTGKKRIGGFSYYARAETWPTSGSMTTAGLCIAGVAREVVGRRLGRGILGMIGKSEPLALGWLDHYWRPDRNPGYKVDEGHLYYLYGVERVAAFYGPRALETHDWYLDGAEWLVKNQDDDGGWGRPEETAFALLFLTRATAAATTGPKERMSDSVVHADSGAVHIRSTGNFQRTFFLDGFDAELIESRASLPPGRRGLRVVSVEWWVNGELVATVPGDPGERYSMQRYPTRWTAPGPGSYRVAARVRVGLAGSRPGDEPFETEVLESSPLPLDLKWSAATWIEAAGGHRGDSLLNDVEWTSTASSGASELAADAAFDSLDATHWLASAEDPQPWIRVEVTRPIEASMVTLAHAGSSYGERDEYAAATEVEVLVNGKSIGTTTVEPRNPATMVIPLPSELRVRSLEIRVVAQVPGKSAPVGFSTVGLR